MLLTMGDVLAYAGAGIALLGVALCVGLACLGSARGTGAAGEAGAGLLAEDPSKFGQVILFQVLPGSQGLYGFAIAFLTFNAIGGMGGLATLTLAQGLMFFAAAIPMAIGGLTAIPQGRVAAAAIGMIARQEGGAGRGILLCIVVEIYALLAFVLSFLALNAISI